jgi:hypothetical protein
MGYDYNWEHPDDPDGERSYFRLNVGGGARFAHYMQRLGMAFDAGQPPKWPRRRDFGLTEEQTWRDPSELTGEALDARKRYDAAVGELLAWHGPEIPGIPIHKIADSNDGWHVLPAECTAAVRIYRQRPTAEVNAVVPASSRDYWDQWIAYIAEAADHGGFRTY